MARPLRIEFPGGVYHITSRGNAKQKIFLDDRDYRHFLGIIGDTAASYDWQCYAYCLMPNHYHLVLTTATGRLSRGMRHLNSVYAQRFHNRHGSVGHVFQGRFKSIVVDREPYLLEVCRYVLLNPVRAGLVEEPGAWAWSSYQPTLGRRPRPAFLASDWLVQQFGPTPQRASKAFEKFVEEGRTARSPWKKVRAGIFLGDDGFVSGFSRHIAGKKGILEIPGEQRKADRPPLEEIITGTRNEALLSQQLLQARNTWGYGVKDICRHLGLHRNTVAAMLKRGASASAGSKTPPD